jgi:hypothetical protein
MIGNFLPAGGQGKALWSERILKGNIETCLDQ